MDVPVKSIEKRAMEWMLSGDTGVSSETICATLMDIDPKGTMGPDVPHDPSDFGRCYRLLQLIPEWNLRLHEVAEKHPMWGPFINAWPEMVVLYELEITNKDGRLPKLYKYMKQVRHEARLADGWVETTSGSYVRKGGE